MIKTTKTKVEISTTPESWRRFVRVAKKERIALRSSVIGFGLFYAGTLTACLAWLQPDVIGFAAVLAVPLVWLSAVDLDRQIIPDRATLTIVSIGLVRLAFVAPNSIWLWSLAAVITLALFWLLGEVYYHVRGTDGFGVGDAKLLAAATVWVEPMNIPLAIFLAAVGAVIAVLVTSRGETEKLKSPVPFGPFLAYATYTVFLLSQLNDT